jgi:hypothetical protein
MGVVEQRNDGGLGEEDPLRLRVKGVARRRVKGTRGGKDQGIVVGARPSGEVVGVAGAPDVEECRRVLVVGDLRGAKQVVVARPARILGALQLLVDQAHRDAELAPPHLLERLRDLPVGLRRVVDELENREALAAPVPRLGQEAPGAARVPDLDRIRRVASQAGRRE